MKSSVQGEDVGKMTFLIAGYHTVPLSIQQW